MAKLSAKIRRYHTGVVTYGSGPVTCGCRPHHVYTRLYTHELYTHEPIVYTRLMAKLSAQAMRGLPGERVQSKPEIPFSKEEGDLAARYL